MYPVPQRIGCSPVARSGRKRRASLVAACSVAGDITRIPSSSPPRQRISANLDSSFALDTVLDDGITLVRNSGVLENGMIRCGVPPTAILNAFAIGGGSGFPVTWLGATNGTSSAATP